MVILIWITLFVLIFILIYFLAIEPLKRKLLFSPTRKIVWEPDKQYQDLYIDLNGEIINPDHYDEYINLWYFNNFPGQDIVLYCHGSDRNISYREYVVELAEQAQLNLVLFDYRGYGRSKGVPSQQKVYEDGLAVYHYVSKLFSPNQIIISGESLGGTVAGYLAQYKEGKKLVLLSTFSSIADIALYGKLPKLVSIPLYFFIKLTINNMPTKEFIRSTEKEVIIVHSLEDELIPYRCAQINYYNIPHHHKILYPINGKHRYPKFTEAQAQTLTRLIKY